MLPVLILAVTAPVCTEVRQPCRACTEVAGRPRCSNIGIACQPKVPVCRAPKDGPAEARKRGDIATDGAVPIPLAR